MCPLRSLSDSSPQRTQIFPTCLAYIPRSQANVAVTKIDMLGEVNQVMRFSFTLQKVAGTL